MKAEGLSPDQAAAYSTVYARMGILDPTEQAKRAKQDFALEQIVGASPGGLAGAGMSMVGAGGYVQGTHRQLSQAHYNQQQQWIQNDPANYMTNVSGMQMAAQSMGQCGSRLGMSDQQVFVVRQGEAKAFFNCKMLRLGPKRGDP